VGVVTTGRSSTRRLYDYLSEYEYAEIAKGKIVQVKLTIRRDRDTILFRRPPPVKVHDFNVEEKAAPEQQWPGFGRPLGPGQCRFARSNLLARWRYRER
jgi:hypothetical protein